MSVTPLRHKAGAPETLNFAVIICSSSRYHELKSGKQIEDPSGDRITHLLEKHGHSVTFRIVVPDEKLLIERAVRRALKSRDIDVIITCGGTGISPEDVTIETVQPLLDKELYGFGEVFRTLSYEKIGSAAILTRAIAGVSKRKAIFCIPGSPQAVSLAVERLILLEAGHIVKHARERSDGPE